MKLKIRTTDQLNIHLSRYNNLSRLEVSRRLFRLSQGIAFGSLDNLMYHEGVELKSPNKGYIESGLIVDNIYRQKLMKLFYIGVGAGVFKRWGYYQNVDKTDNYTYRLVWNIGF